MRKLNFKYLATCYVFCLQDDLILCSGMKDEPMTVAMPASPSPSLQTIRGEVSSSCTSSSETQTYTENALKELYQQVNNMPESAKKKKLIRQVPHVPRPILK